MLHFGSWHGVPRIARFLLPTIPLIKCIYKNMICLTLKMMQLEWARNTSGEISKWQRGCHVSSGILSRNCWARNLQTLAGKSHHAENQMRRLCLISANLTTAVCWHLGIDKKAIGTWKRAISPRRTCIWFFNTWYCIWNGYMVSVACILISSFKEFILLISQVSQVQS